MQWKNICTCFFTITYNYPNDDFSCIHSILGSNVLMYKMNTVTTQLRTFCRTENKILLHLFWECDTSQVRVLIKKNVKGNIGMYLQVAF